MGKKIEQIGTKYGHLTVIGESELRIRGRVCWKCQCDCGNVIDVIGTDLRTGRKTDCGCKDNPNIINEIGKRYGKLTVIKKGTTSKDRSINWICKCDCGKIVEVNGRHLRSGATQSCGCNSNNAPINELGNRYGKLLVIDKKIEDNHTLWVCQCDCGNIVYRKGAHLREQKNCSCGCIKSYGAYLTQKYLQEHNINYKTEITFPNLKSSNGGLLRFDFGIYNIENKLQGLIEYQGIQHFIPNISFGKLQREETDKLKSDFCIKNNIPLFYINYDEDTYEKLNEIISNLNLC